MLTRNLIFNQNGSSDKNKRSIIGGDTCFINEMNELKYPWAYEFYKEMAFTNFWLPQEIQMLDDKKMYETSLTSAEKRAYKLVLAFLVALDSFQVNMLKEFSRYITAPEIIMALTAQEYQESVHSFSYQFIFESVMSPVETKHIYNLWREDSILNERNVVISELYNNFVSNPTDENFVLATIGNYILESLYFWSGFTFFYVLGKQAKMLRTVQQIRYINRDEDRHVSLFKRMINSLKQEKPDLFTESMNKTITELFYHAAMKEIEWGKYITKNQILGLPNELLEKYIKYLTNIRMTEIGFEPLFPEVTSNPMEWITKFKSIKDKKHDFFSMNSANYTNKNVLYENMNFMKQQ